jgi:hypothetical protein
MPVDETFVFIRISIGGCLYVSDANTGDVRLNWQEGKSYGVRLASVIYLAFHGVDQPNHFQPADKAYCNADPESF